MSDGKTGVVTVLHDEETITVVSPAVGNKPERRLVVDAGKVKNAWDFFTTQEKQAFDRLTRLRSGQQVEASYTDLTLFKGAAERAQATPDADPPGTQPPVVEKAACAPVTAPVVAAAPVAPPAPPSLPPQPASAPVNRPQGTPNPEQTRRRSEITRVAAAAGGSHVLFIYDIPDTSGVANPSGRLWRHGFRCNLSCWVLPVGQIARITDLLDEFDANNIRWHTVTFADSERNKIKDMAREALDNEVRRAHTSLLRSLQLAQEGYDNALKEITDRGHTPTNRQRWRLQGKHVSHVRGAIKAAGEKLNAAVESAVLFDESMDLADLFRSLRQAVASANESLTALEYARNQL